MDLSTSIPWIKEADHGISLYDLKQKRILSLSPMSQKCMAMMDSEERVWPLHSFKMKRIPCAIYPIRFKSGLSPLSLTSMIKGIRGLTKSQTHLNGSSLKVDLRQDTNGYMLHQVMNITELLKGLDFPFTKDDKNYLSGRGNYKIVFGHFST